MDPPKFMLAPLSMTIAKNALWRRGITYIDWIREELDYDEFNHTRLMPSLIVELCVPSSHLFLFLLSSFAFLNMVTLKWNTCTRLPLLLVFLLALLICLRWYMPMALMALLGSIPWLENLMSWVIPSLRPHEQRVLFHFFLCFFLSCISQLLVLTLLPSNFSPLFRSMRSWFSWLWISS